MALYTYGLCSQGLYSYGLYSYGLCSQGLYSYGLYRFAKPFYTVAAPARVGAPTCIDVHRVWFVPVKVFSAYLVMALYSYGLYSYGLYSYGLYSYGLYSHGLYSYGLCSYGRYGYGLYSYVLYSHGLYSYVVMATAVCRRRSRFSSTACNNGVGWV